MTNTDKYGFKKKWIKPATQAAVYRRFVRKQVLARDGEEYVLSHTSVDPKFRSRLIKVMLKHIKKRDCVLSVAEGQGDLIRALKRMGVKDIQGVDICKELVKIGKVKGGKIQVAQAGDLPFEDETFDVVIINEAIGAIGLANPLKEARRVLKRSGQIIISSYNYAEDDQEDAKSSLVKYRYISPKLITKALKEKKFKKVALESIPISPVPKNLAKEGHTGDEMDIITAVKR